MSRTSLAKTVKQILRLTKLGDELKMSGSELFERHSEAITRRDVLRRSFQAAAAIPLVNAFAHEALANQILKSSRSYRRHSASADTPIVIIGAGTAGLTAAYRLIKAGIPCVIYEGSSRVGGRMFTQSNFNRDGMFCERGGELVDSDDTDLMNLCAELGVEIQSLEETDTSLNRELYNIGGRFYSAEDLLGGFAPLARTLRADIQTIYGSSTVEVATYKNPFNSLQYDRLSLKEYLGRQTGVDRWVLDLIDVCYTGEYGLETDEQSALNLISLIDPSPVDKVLLLGASDESKRIKGGSSTLPDTLSRLLKDDVVMHMGHELVKLTDDGTNFHLHFKTAGHTVEIKTPQVVCTLPFSTLRKVEGIYSLGLSPRKKKAIREWGYGTNSKLMTGHTSRVWRHLPGAAKSDGMVYTDTESQEFWETSRGQIGASGIMTNFRGGKSGKNLSIKHLDDTLNDLDQIFPGSKSQFDGNKTLQHWPSSRFAKGSFTCTLPGQFNEIYGSAGEPELRGRLLFAGEHTSVDYSGFMNGAVESGNTVAKTLISQRPALHAAASFRKHV